MTSKDQDTLNPEKPAPSRGPVEGRDELNLIELPFSLVSNDYKQNLSTIERRWTEQGREFYLTISPNVTFGLPTFRAEEVTIAALELTYRRGFKSRQVHTTKQELLEIMRWHDNGHYRQAVVTAFSQLKGVSIFTNRFWDHKRKEYLDAQTGFGIIDDFAFYDDESRGRGQMVLPLSYFRWNEVLWDSFQAGYIKRLNTSVYFSLSSNLARRLYRYVDKWLYQGGQEIDLQKLATVKLGMSDQYPYPSLIANKLRPAIAELNERGVARIRIEKSKSTESAYKVVIEPPQSCQSVAKPRKGIREPGPRGKPVETQFLASGGHSTPNQGLVDQLTSRGLSPATAQRLVQKHDPSRVGRHLEVFDFLVQKPDHDIKNPPAYLRKMIEEGWFVDRLPEGFTSREEQEEDRQRQEHAKAVLIAEYQQAAAKIRSEVGEWAALPPEKRINFFFLDEWIKLFRRQHQRTPSEAEQAERVHRLVAELRTPEQELAHRLSVLQLDFAQKAAKQGIGDLSLPQ